MEIWHDSDYVLTKYSRNLKTTKTCGLTRLTGWGPKTNMVLTIPKILAN